MVTTWVCAGPDGDEAIAACSVCERVSTSDKVRIQRSVVLVSLVQITSCGIRLPDFDERMRNWPRVLIQHSAAHNDPFAERLAAVLSRQIASLHLGRFFSEQRPLYFRNVVRPINPRFASSPLVAGHVCSLTIL